MLLLAATLQCLALTVFTPGAFLIRRQVGQLGFATETEWQYSRDGVPAVPNPMDPSQPKRTIEASGSVVRLFDAKLESGRRVLLKEFVGDARAIGGNEAAMYSIIYERASEGLPPMQLGTLLGTMSADASFATEAFMASWAAALPGCAPPSTDGLWLVFAWEGLATVAGFAGQPQQRAWFDFDGRLGAKARAAYVKTACKRILEVVGWLHAQGVVHRSLGSSSLILSTHDQTVTTTDLQAKIIDLGFATSAARLTPDEITDAMARGAKSPLDVVPFLTRADDLHALTYVLLELVLASALPPDSASTATGSTSVGSGTSGGPPTDVQSLKRLVEDVFDGDVCGEFRSYCAEEPEWAAAVALLDEGDGAGWRLVQAFAACRDAKSEAAQGASCQSALESEWFNER